MRKMSITPIDDAGVLRSLILIILPILGFWMLGIVFGGGMGVKKRHTERERERERTRVGKRPFCTSKFLIDMVGPNELT